MTRLLITCAPSHLMTLCCGTLCMAAGRWLGWVLGGGVQQRMCWPCAHWRLMGTVMAGDVRVSIDTCVGSVLDQLLWLGWRPASQVTLLHLLKVLLLCLCLSLFVLQVEPSGCGTARGARHQPLLCSGRKAQRSQHHYLGKRTAVSQPSHTTVCSLQFADCMSVWQAVLRLCSC
jgi:hypothetical protein